MGTDETKDNDVTKYTLQHLPIGASSPCGLTQLERAVIVYYMSCELLEDIADCETFMFVATLRRRMHEWVLPDRVKLAKMDNVRFGPIAKAVIEHVKLELQKLDEPQ